MSDVWFGFILMVVIIGGAYLKGRFDGAEKVRQDNRTLNESRRKS